MKALKTAVIDVGGGMRGIYASGVFDFCLDKGISFDLCIGVSAGSANMASYLAGQKKRNYQFYLDYAFRKEYMSVQNFLRKKSYVDLDYIYDTLSQSAGENPLDYQALMDHPAELQVVATDARTGEAVYFSKEDLKQDDYHIFKASSALPFICRPYEINGTPYYDGALSDPVPVERSLQSGCEKIVLILTRPVTTPRAVGKDIRLSKMIQKNYPEAAERLRLRAERYNRCVSLAKYYALKGRVLIVAPDDISGLDTLTKDRAALERFYEKGRRDAKAIPIFLSANQAA